MPPLLFVNKTAKSQSLTKSDGLERSQIHSHVQRTFVVPSHVVPAISQDLDHADDNAPPPLPSPSPSSSRRKSSSSSPPSRPASKTPTPRHSAREKKASRPPRSPATSSVASPASVSSSPPPSARSIVSTASRTSPPALSPLSDAPLALSNVNPAPYMDMLMKFYQNPMINRVFPVKRLAGESHGFTVNLAAHDSSLLYSLLCSTASAWFVDSGNVNHQVATTFFKGQALVALREGLFSNPDQTPQISSLMAIALLLWNECIQGDVQHAAAHISGLQNLLSRTKNLERSPLPVASTVFGCASMSSAMLRRRPPFAPPIPGPSDVGDKILAAVDACADPSIKSLGVRFFSPANERLMGAELQEMILEQHICSSFKELCRSDHLDPDYKDTKSIYSRQTYLEYRLVCLPFDNEFISSSQLAVSIALYICCQPIVTITKPWSAFARSLSTQLKNALAQTDLESTWDESADLLLWVLLICAHVSRGQTQWHWCFYHISRLLWVLGLHTIDNTRELLQGFFWHGITYEDTLLDIYQALNQLSRSEISTFSFESYHGSGIVSFDAGKEAKYIQAPIG